MRKLMNKIYKLTACALASSMLFGCASDKSMISSIYRNVDASKDKAIERLAERVQPGPVALYNYSEQSWMPLRRVERSERDLANAKTDSIQIEINQRITSLNDIAGVISSLTGLTVFIDPDVASPQTSVPGQAAPTGLLAGPMPTPFPSGVPNFASSAQGTPSGAITSNSPFAANYAGSLTGFMNLVTAYYGISWKTESSGLRMFLMDSKTFRIASLPGDTRLSSGVDSVSSSTGGGAGSSTQTGSSQNSTGVSFSSLSVWTALETSIKQMLSAKGKVIASPATGTITVTDTPSALSRVTEFINYQNKSLNRQVSVNVRVLSVELNDGDNYGINWDSVYSNLQSASNPFSVALKTAFPMTAGAGSLILSSPATSASRWAGSSAMVSALSTQGRVSELTSSTLITLNNQPAPVNVGRKVSYLASSSTTQTPNVGSTTTLTPGTVQTGFSMTLVPHILGDRELLLQYSIDLSSLLRLTSITSGTSLIQAPDISTSNFIQRVRIGSGETLVVAGFDQDNLSAVLNGVGSADNTLLGSRTGTTKRTMLVVMIQPTLVN